MRVITPKQVGWVWSVAYKAKHSRKLHWIQTTTRNASKASDQARLLASKRGIPGIEYGLSKTHFGGRP